MKDPMEDKSLKAAVLAKCGEAGDYLKMNEWEITTSYGGKWTIEHYSGDITFCIDENAPETSHVWPLAAEILGIKPEPVPFFESQLHELCVALGWQGGTYHQVLEEIKRLKAADGKPKEARPSNDLLWEAFLLGEKIGSQPPSLVRDAVFEEWLATLPPDPLEADRKVLREAYGKVASPYFYRGDSKRFFDSYKRLAGMEVKNG